MDMRIRLADQRKRVDPRWNENAGLRQHAGFGQGVITSMVVT